MMDWAEFLLFMWDDATIQDPFYSASIEVCKTFVFVEVCFTIFYQTRGI